MKIRRKLSTCQNCCALLDRRFNFCPECGQENDDKNVSFGIIFKEFLDTFFALDSSFFRTFKPFILKPGFLTLEFVSGKRKSYANPIRLYLIISIFYFFSIGIMGRYIVNSSDVDENNVVVTDSLVSRYTQIINIDTLNNGQKKRLIAETFDEMTFQEQMNMLDSLDEKETTQMYELGLVDYSGFGNQYYDPAQFTPDSAYVAKMEKDTSALIFNRINDKLIKELDYRGNYSDQEILDSMNLGKLKWWEEYFALQRIRVERSGGEAVTDYIVQNMSVMMLLVIPVFALILKLVYIRRKTLYVQHLIHALHLHSFAYLAYGVINLILIYAAISDVIGFFLSLSIFIGVSTYAYTSFLKVYNQGWFKTIIKFNLVGWIYLFMLATFFAIEAGISFLMY